MKWYVCQDQAAVHKLLCKSTPMNHSMTWISGKFITLPMYLLFGMSEHCVVLISQWVKLKCICIKQFAPNNHIAMHHLMKTAVSWCYSGSHLTPSLWLMSCLSSLVRRCDFYICFPSPRVPQKLNLPTSAKYFPHLSRLGKFSFSLKWRKKLSRAPGKDGYVFLIKCSETDEELATEDNMDFFDNEN